MDNDKSKDLGKLGTILAIHNEIIRDQSKMMAESLEMLKKQQERQARIIWAVIGMVALVIVLSCMSNYMIMNSVDKVSDQIKSTCKVMEVVAHEREQANSKRLSKHSSTD